MNESDSVSVSTPTSTTAADAVSRTERLTWFVTEFREFREEGYRSDGYPDEDDLQHQRARVEFEEILHSLPDLGYDNCDVVADIWTKRYGKVGQAAGWKNSLFNDEAKWPEIRSRLYDLCFGDGDVSSRIDDAIADKELRGVGLVIATKLPAICHPQHIIPNYVLVGESPSFPGKLAAVDRLHRLSLLNESASVEATAIARGQYASDSDGTMAMRTNDLLLDALRPQFADNDEVDTWGMAQFLYWLARPRGMP